MKIEDLNDQIKKIVLTLHSLGLTETEIGLYLFESSTTQIQTLKKNGSIQYKSLLKVARSMHTEALIALIDDDESEDYELKKKILESNKKKLDNVIPTIVNIHKTLSGKNMKTGLVNKSKARERLENIRKSFIVDLEKLQDDDENIIEQIINGTKL